SGEAETEAETTTPIIEEIVAGQNLGGKTFNIGYAIQYDFNEVDFDEETGDIIDDAVYQRNRMTEDKLGVTIVGTNMCTWTDIQKTMQKMMQSGDCPYDSVCGSAWFMYLSSVNGYLYDLFPIQKLGLEHDWWDKETLAMYSFGSNNLYFVSGDINYTDNLAMAIICFNKKIADSIGYEYPYQQVRDGKWTFDRLIEMGHSYGSDIDGDGKMTTADTFGFGDNQGVINRLINSAGITVIEVDNEGTATLNQSEKIVSVIDKIREGLAAKSIPTSAIVSHGFSDEDVTSLFNNGQMFVTMHEQVNQLFRMRQQTTDDFGIIPTPKYDESQEKYWTFFSTAAGSCYAIPMTNTDLDSTGLILDVMGYYSQDTITPAVIDRSVMGKGTRDTESEEMLKLIFTSKIFDLGMWGSDIYGEVLSFIDKDNVASILEKSAKKVPKQFEIIKEFYTYG
ncbi:MAG: extracellular solute-binding protein, partial [Clostridiales bacterium]|nr:extracellular solute-binding protein [Clostridiales bacterium]